MQGIFKAMKEHEEKMQAVDTSNAAEMIFVQPMVNVLREDVRKQDFTREELLEGAPVHSVDSWQVPRLVK